MEAEPELRNNERSVLVKVEEQQFNILYFEGEPRWEYKFIRKPESITFKPGWQIQSSGICNQTSSFNRWDTVHNFDADPHF